MGLPSSLCPPSTSTSFSTLFARYNTWLWAIENDTVSRISHLAALTPVTRLFSVTFQHFDGPSILIKKLDKYKTSKTNKLHYNIGHCGDITVDMQNKI